jgi:hypothetical protein
MVITRFSWTVARLGFCRAGVSAEADVSGADATRADRRSDADAAFKTARSPRFPAPCMAARFASSNFRARLGRHLAARARRFATPPASAYATSARKRVVRNAIESCEDGARVAADVVATDRGAETRGATGGGASLGGGVCLAGADAGASGGAATAAAVATLGATGRVVTATASALATGAGGCGCCGLGAGAGAANGAAGRGAGAFDLPEARALDTLGGGGSGIDSGEESTPTVQEQDKASPRRKTQKQACARTTNTSDLLPASGTTLPPTRTTPRRRPCPGS